MSSEELLRLLHSGDWACVFNEPASLRRVCDELAEHLADPALAGHARAVAALADRDLGAAARAWRNLASTLRADAPPLRPAG